MFLELDPATAQTRVGGTTDLKRLEARLVAGSAPTASTAELSRALGPLGDADADGRHLWINSERLRALANPTGAADWNTAFDQMLAYARSKGWVDAAGTAVRVHLTDR